MEFDGIVDFIALAESKSFSKAAESRRVTQSAFSRRIQSLESDLGVKLIDRDTTPVSLTKAGARFLVHARLLTDTFDQAVEEAQSQVSALPDPVYLSTPHSISFGFFPPWYKNLQRRIPELRMHLTPRSGSQCIAALRNGLADMTIIMLADGVVPCFSLDGIETRKIGQDKLVAVRAKHTPADCASFLSYEKGTYMESAAAAVIARAGENQRMQAVFESASSELLKAMALSGFGVAVLPESLVSDDLAQEYLVEAFAPSSALNCDLFLARPAGKASTMGEAVWREAAAA